MSDDVDTRMKSLREQMNRARMRLAAERMDRRTREYQRSAAARAEEEECGPGTAQPIGELSARLVEALGQVSRGEGQTMSIAEACARLRGRKGLELVIPEGTDEEAGAIKALAEAKIEELGPRRFGAAWGIRSSVWWTVLLFAEDGYSRDQILEIMDERAAEHREWLKEPDMFDADKVQAQLDLWAEVRAAITAA